MTRQRSELGLGLGLGRGERERILLELVIAEKKGGGELVSGQTALMSYIVPSCNSEMGKQVNSLHISYTTMAVPLRGKVSEVKDIVTFSLDNCVVPWGLYSIT